jgi:hypothetical protein
MTRSLNKRSGNQDEQLMGYGERFGKYKFVVWYVQIFGTILLISDIYVITVRIFTGMFRIKSHIGRCGLTMKKNFMSQPSMCTTTGLLG